MQGIFDFFDSFKHTDDNGEFPRELEKKYIISDKVLGKGTFAVVRECTEKQTNKSYALKIISKKAIKGREKMLTAELDILKKVKNPYTISLHDLYENRNGVFIITDLALGGELFNQLILKGTYTEQDAANIIKQLLEGVVYLHNLGIVHRDLKPENILFKDKSKYTDIVITDFGLSRILKSKNDVLLTSCGTPGYVAPEVLSNVGYGKSVDIWSIGVMIYAMLCGYTPFSGEGQTELLESIIEGSYYYEEEDWSEISNLAKDLIDRMLIYEPSKRITAKEALEHPWFELVSKVDIVEKIKNNLSAKDKFKKAIHVIQGVNRMHKLKKSTISVDNDHKLIVQNRIQERIEEKKRIK